MKLRELQAKSNAIVHRVSVYEDLIARLRDCAIPSPIETLLVPDEVKQAVIQELEARMNACCEELAAFEEIDVKLPAPDHNVLEFRPK